MPFRYSFDTFWLMLFEGKKRNNIQNDFNYLRVKKNHNHSSAGETTITPATAAATNDSIATLVHTCWRRRREKKIHWTCIFSSSIWLPSRIVEYIETSKYSFYFSLARVRKQKLPDTVYAYRNYVKRILNWSKYLLFVSLAVRLSRSLPCYLLMSELSIREKNLNSTEHVNVYNNSCCFWWIAPWNSIWFESQFIACVHYSVSIVSIEMNFQWHNEKYLMNRRIRWNWIK